MPSDLVCVCPGHLCISLVYLAMASLPTVYRQWYRLVEFNVLLSLSPMVFGPFLLHLAYRILDSRIWSLQSFGCDNFTELVERFSIKMAILQTPQCRATPLESILLNPPQALQALVSRIVSGASSKLNKFYWLIAFKTSKRSIDCQWSRMSFGESRFRWAVVTTSLTIVTS